MKNLIFTIKIIIILFGHLFSQATLSNVQIENKIDSLLQQLTIEEKIDLLSGTGFETKPISRLGIPSLKMCDGPLGVNRGKSTAFPSGILMAATFNPELIEQVGEAIAQETKAHKRDLILGPCVNIARIPMGGRNFESFGEDPYLTSQIAISYIKGVQSQNVAATIKHFAVNNQEYQRDFVNVIVSERALNEIYFPVFKSAVEEANVLAVMAAYNKVNGFYCSENEFLLKKKLKGEWGFKGIVMSDWGAVHSSIPAFKNGLDLEMPNGKYLNQKNLLNYFKDHHLSEEELNDKVRRLLRVMFKIGLFENRIYDTTKLNTEEHKKLALDVAREGIVLLKNENNILPLNFDKIKSIAVVGPTSNVAVTGGGGSSMVTPFYSISPLEALKNKIGNKIKINFAQGVSLNGVVEPINSKFLFVDTKTRLNGLRGEYFTNKDLKGSPVKIRIDTVINFNWQWESPFENFPEDQFSVRWTGFIRVDKTNQYTIDVLSDDGIRLYFDNKLVIDDWNDHAELTNSFTIKLEANKFYKIKLEFYENGGAATCRLGLRETDTTMFINAINAAKNSDVALVFVGTNYTYESEGFDRKDLNLPENQDNLIKAISNVNKNTIVILNTGSPVLMASWINMVPAILETWFGGEQIGNAIADILIGETNPSGKLPITFPVKWEDCSAFPTYMKEDSVSRYDDDIFIGYRHFDKYNIEPQFPFGYGLSYTTFEFKNLRTYKDSIKLNEKIQLSFTLKNTGQLAGKEVAQLYIKPLNTKIKRAQKELKRFQKVNLKPTEEKIIMFILSGDDFKYYDEDKKDWSLEPGEYEILIGSSSEDIKLRTKIVIQE